MKRKLLYEILVAVAVAGITLSTWKLMIPSPAIPGAGAKLSYNVSGCEEREEREYTKVRGMERVDVEIDGGFVKLTHHLSYVCCAKIRVYFDSFEVHPNYTLIKLKEKNEGEMCRCMCDYDVHMEVGALQKGKYRIQIFGVEYGYMPAELLWEKEISIDEKAGLPNPASVYCVEQGGRLEIRKDVEGNEYGVCVFSDGSECEEWAFFRGECRPSKEVFCGWSTHGYCSNDLDCIKGGCSGQVCQSKLEEPVITTCEWRDCYNAGVYGLECRCINGQCQWYRE